MAIDLKTRLGDLVLRYDGIYEAPSDKIYQLLLNGVKSSGIRALDSSSELTSFNANVIEVDKINPVIQESVSLDFSWNLPKEYLAIDLIEYVAEKFEKLLPSLNYTDVQTSAAIDRITKELDEIGARGMTEFTQTIIYILDRFKDSGEVWGVGRGSSCASYVLFLLGLHLVDCIKYDIPMEEFFHD